MRGGRLHRPITIEVKTETPDTFGEVIETWSTFATTRGSVEPLSGRELLESLQVKGASTIQVKLRFIPGVTVEMRLKLTSDNDRILAINSISDVATKGRELVLMCSERVS
jgi:SPP1 family predicted phage head-tail adaptor